MMGSKQRPVAPQINVSLEEFAPPDHSIGIWTLCWISHSSAISRTSSRSPVEEWRRLAAREGDMVCWRRSWRRVKKERTTRRVDLPRAGAYPLVEPPKRSDRKTDSHNGQESTALNFGERYLPGRVGGRRPLLPSSGSGSESHLRRELVQDRYVSGMGCPSVDPVVFFKLQLVMFFEGVRSERLLLRLVADLLSDRWYLGYNLDEPLPDPSSLTRIRTRYGLDIFRRFFEAIVEQCQQAGLVWGKELYFDATYVLADASLDSLTPRFTAEAWAALHATWSPSSPTRLPTKSRTVQQSRQELFPRSSLLPRMGILPIRERPYCPHPCR